jgi:hypothetical protein
VNGAGCRRKGHSFERAMVHRFAEVFGAENVRRGLQYREGSECPDVVVPGFWTECKRGRKTNIRAALAQAIEASEGKGLWPVAVCKDDHANATATMLLDDFLELLREMHELKTRVKPS